MNKKWRRKIPLFILLGIGGLFAISGVVMLLWNGILPVVLHAGVITFWQAMGLLVLSKILFGGFKGRRGFGNQRWGRYMYNQCRNMTPEEKEKFRDTMRQRMGKWQMHDDTQSAEPAV